MKNAKQINWRLLRFCCVIVWTRTLSHTLTNFKLKRMRARKERKGEETKISDEWTNELISL